METELMSISVTRGCGRRKPGGIYFETALSPFGTPVVNFLCDPPLPLADRRDISAVGTQIVERDGIYHILDWVGQEHYPHVADFVEEIKRFGLSRRLAETLDFSKLTASSRIILIHSRAIIENFNCYPTWNCPQRQDCHKPNPGVEPQQMCAGLWWECIDEETQLANLHQPHSREIVRQMPSFSYQARCSPEGVTPRYQPGIFASFPPSRLVLVEGGERQEEKWSKLNQSTIPTASVEE